MREMTQIKTLNLLNKFYICLLIIFYLLYKLRMGEFILKLLNYISFIIYIWIYLVYGK